LRGITWDHTRGLLPMVATAQRFGELNPDVEITWHKRSLQAFADEPIDKLATEYDLIVLDHPWSGFLAATRATLPLDDHLPAEFLADQADHSVGTSHRSYGFNGKQWALAIDAATPVASWRPDLLPVVPQTWDDLLELARAGRVLMPGIPIDSLMHFYGLCSTLGEDVCTTPDCVISDDVGVTALRMLRELASLIDPILWTLNPIRVYERMTRTDRFAYCPFAYGYSNYARPGYARTTLRFGDLVRVGSSGPLVSTLGGTGLAVTSRCRAPDLAVRYASFVADPDTQRRLYADAGGQPGHRAAWTDDHANAITGNYFRDTLPALDRAFLRPRFAGAMHFQDHAGAPVQRFMREGGDPRAAFVELNALYAASLTDG
jgi:multiple sugar transport system substrate-binding protein